MDNSPYLRRPRLVFAPLAWLKFQFLCHRGDTEVSGFGISARDRPLYIEEFVTLPQYATAVTTAFRDAEVADYFDRCVDRGLSPDRFARLWLHTHPGASVTPSSTDESTFTRVFGGCDRAVMAILGRTGNTYARLSYSVGPKADLEIATLVDWAAWPEAAALPDKALDAQVAQWAAEYAAHVHQPLAACDQSLPPPTRRPAVPTELTLDDWFWDDTPDWEYFTDPYGEPYEQHAMLV